jgi:adenosine deaminase CECR1
MMSNDLAITISSDDSVIYGYNGLTYDYWMAYTSWNLTLAGLKKLTQNGIQYSALPLSVKEQKLQQLDSLWTNWIADVVKDFLY